MSKIKILEKETIMFILKKDFNCPLPMYKYDQR